MDRFRCQMNCICLLKFFSLNQVKDFLAFFDWIKIDFLYFVVVVIVEAEDLKEIHKIKNKDVEKFVKKNQLAKNEEIRSFIKVRLSILLRSYEKEQQKSSDEINSKSINLLFIRRLLEAETELIKSAIDFLN